MVPVGGPSGCAESVTIHTPVVMDGLTLPVGGPSVSVMLADDVKVSADCVTLSLCDVVSVTLHEVVELCKLAVTDLMIPSTSSTAATLLTSVSD